MAQPAIQRRKRSASRRAQLLDAAARIFIEKGYRETGIEVILKQAGLTGPALYRHFTSKQEILDTICLTAAEGTLALANEVKDLQGLGGSEKLRELIKRRLDYLFSPDGIASFLGVSQRAHISSDARDQMLKLQREFGEVFCTFLGEVRPDLDGEELRLVFFAAQNLMLYGIWRARGRGLISDAEHRLLLEKMVWSTVMA